MSRRLRSVKWNVLEEIRFGELLVRDFFGSGKIRILLKLGNSFRLKVENL